MQMVVVSRKLDVEAEVGSKRCLDDLLLNLAVERDGDLPAGVVLPDADQRVLLGELGEGDSERAPVVRTARDDDGLQCRRGELGLLRHMPVRRANRVADLDIGQTPQLPESLRRTTDPRRHSIRRRRRGSR